MQIQDGMLILTQMAKNGTSLFLFYSSAQRYISSSTCTLLSCLLSEVWFMPCSVYTVSPFLAEWGGKMLSLKEKARYASALTLYLKQCLDVIICFCDVCQWFQFGICCFCADISLTKKIPRSFLMCYKLSPWCWWIIASYTVIGKTAACGCHSEHFEFAFLP